MEELKLFGNESNGISIINDPFSSIKNIDEIHMHLCRRKSILSNKEVISVSGSVHFNNGKTEGRQNFEAKDLTELFESIRDFCLSFKE